MRDTHTFLDAFCHSGARALAQYARISGEEPSTAPEYFMPAFIMNDLGNAVHSERELTFTLETTFSTLREWNCDAKARAGDTLPTDLVRLAEERKSSRVDMVLFAGAPGTHKHAHDFVALIEFKRGNLEEEHGNLDRSRLLRLLRHIDTCEYGIVCGSVEERYLNYQRERALGLKDAWCSAAVPELENRFSFCARLFSCRTVERGEPNRPGGAATSLRA
jgi:hypothetical protein